MNDSSSSSATSGMTIDIRPMIEDVSKIMTKHITTILSGVIGEYSIYKETHDTIMGLPCVRRLQERISELEEGREPTTTTQATTTQAGGSAATSAREHEIVELQSAIAELNRYITALESKVNTQNVSKEEESVKLEIHEADAISENDEDATEPCIVSSTHKNIIISNASEADAEEAEEAEAEEAEAEEAEAEEAEAEEADAEDTEAEAEEAEDTEADAEAEAEEAVEEEAEEEAEEAEEAEADAEAEDAEADAEAAEAEEAEDAEEEAEAEDAEADAEAEEAEEEAEDAEEEAEAEEEEAEDAEAEAEEAEEAEAEEAAEAEDAEIEVSEVKIKGKTYFTTDAVNGIIYACVDDDVGDEVGVFKNGVAVFNKSKK